MINFRRKVGKNRTLRGYFFRRTAPSRLEGTQYLPDPPEVCPAESNPLETPLVPQRVQLYETQPRFFTSLWQLALCGGLLLPHATAVEECTAQRCRPHSRTAAKFGNVRVTQRRGQTQIICDLPVQGPAFRQKKKVPG